MPNPQTTPDITNRLASILHDLWRAEAMRAGWQHGERYDSQRKLHDALVPYEELPEEDRVQLQLAIECQEIEPRLVRFISRERMRFFARGPSRAANCGPECGSATYPKPTPRASWNRGPRDRTGVPMSSRCNIALVKGPFKRVGRAEYTAK